MGVELMNMKYETIVLGVIFFLCIVLDLFQRRKHICISRQGILSCGCVSAFLLLMLPRIIIWPSTFSLSIVVLLSFIIVVTAWILAYHEA